MVKTDRNFWVVLLLTIVTCGIYGIIFWYNYTEDVNVVCRRDGKNTMNFIVTILLSIITCGIYSFVWYYQLGERLKENAQAYGVQADISGGSLLLWQILGSCIIVGPYIVQYKLIASMNALAAAYNANVNK